MRIITVTRHDHRNQRRFIKFPFTLYKDNQYWVPPIRPGMRKLFKPNYPFYQYGQATFLLAESQDGEVLGRLAVANNHRYNDFHKSKTALFYYFETVNNLDVAKALFDEGYKWAQKQGLNHILGPKGFMVLDGFGMLIKGFEHQPAFGQGYNPPYYPELVEKLGFTKVKDIFTGWLDQTIQWPEKIIRAAEIVEKRVGFTSPELKTKAELKEVLEKFQILYNESLAGPAGNPPVTDEDMDLMVSELLWIADPRLVKLIYKNGKAMGWLLAYPDIGKAIQECKGRLFPFGWLRILIESKRTPWIDLNGIGILEEYQRLGGTAILFNEIYKSVTNLKQYHYGELLQFREENIKILLEMGNFENNFHKTHRLYEKYL